MNIEVDEFELKEVETLEGHTDKVWSVAWKPESSISDSPSVLASCSGDKTVRIWEKNSSTGSYQCKAVLDETHTRTVRSCAWSPSGRHLATASFDATTGVWEQVGDDYECVATLEVEELAFLVKDNLPCKHLLLTMEEELVNFIHHHTSSDGGVLELEPMTSYNRLLLHRLAEIFGFSHYSVGEGDERHLVLERCAETAVPAVLVSDLLWQFDELEGPTMSNILTRKREASSGLNAELSIFNLSLEEREAAYMTARQRIFSVDDGGNRGMVKQRPPNDPIVARRMIVHALGKRTKPANELASQTKVVNIQDKKELITQKSGVIAKVDMKHGSESSRTKSMYGKTEDNKLVPPVTKRSENNMEKDHHQKEHIGAAKRMFVSALGFNLRGEGSTSKSNGSKPTRLSLV